MSSSSEPTPAPRTVFLVFWDGHDCDRNFEHAFSTRELAEEWILRDAQGSYSIDEVPVLDAMPEPDPPIPLVTEPRRASPRACSCCGSLQIVAAVNDEFRCGDHLEVRRMGTDV